jgi:hypothetical protein
MKLHTSLTLLMPLCFAGTASAQSAYGISLPVRGGTDQPANPEAVEEPVLDEDTGIAVVKAETLSDAAAGAAEQAANPKPVKGKPKFRIIKGASLYEDKNGNSGLMVTGTAYYPTDFPNPDAVRTARRGAYIRAHADAMRLLTEKIYGGELERKLAIANKLTKTISETSTLELEETFTEENIGSAVSGLVRGAQVWKCENEGNQVRIWLFTNNDTATGNRHINGGAKVTSAAEYDATVDSIMDEVVNGFLPPLGGKVVICPEAGYVTYVGFGSAIISDTQSGELFASKAAQLRAKAGLVATIRGTQVDYADSLSVQEATSGGDYNNYAKQIPEGEDDAALLTGVKEALNSVQEFTSATSLATKGKMPPGTDDYVVIDDENGWLTAVYVWSVGADSLVSGLRGDAKHEGGGDGASSGAPKRKAFDPTKKGPTGQGKDPRDA